MEPCIEAQQHQPDHLGQNDTEKPLHKAEQITPQAMEKSETGTQRMSHESLPVPSHSSGASTTNGTRSSTSSKDASNDDAALFHFAEELRSENPPAEPWYMEMTRLRRLYFVHLNVKLAQRRKRILERQEASASDMLELRDLLRDQAEAIRDFQYIQSLDILSAGQAGLRREKCEQYFPETARSDFPDVSPFTTENYRCLPRASKAALEPFSDEVREFLRIYLPVQFSWTNAEKDVSPDAYQQGYRPRTLSPNGDRLARFIVAMVGALFILVPMYIMALHRVETRI